jgi:steroid delta-isomerase-like uncharacterized protein
MHSESPGTTARSPEAVVRRLIEEVINGRSYSVLSAIAHEDYVYRTPHEELRGPGALQALFEGYRESFPDLNIRIDRAFGDGENVATRFTLTGTHTGPLMGVPPTGRSVSVSGVVLSRVRDGRIVDEWELIDTTALMSQLGVGEPVASG